MPTFVGRPSTMSSSILVECPQNSMVGQQRQQISELQFDKIPNPQSFLVWKIRFKNQVTTWSDCPSDALLWIKEVEMVDFLEELKSSRSVFGKDFPNFEMLDARIASALNKIIQNSQFKKKVSLEEQKAQKEDRFLRGRQIASMIYDNFRVTGAHDTVLYCADLLSVTLHDYNVQEFETRCDEVVLSVSKIPSDDVLESLYKIENTWVRATQNCIGIVRHGDSSEDIDTQLSQFEDNGEEKFRSETSITKLWRQAGENWNRSSGQESKGIIGVEGGKGICYQWKEKGQCLQGDRCSFRHETQDPTQKPEHTAATPSEPSFSRGRSVEEEVSEAKVTMGPFFDNRADIIWRVLARDHPVDIGILPSVTFTKQKRGAKLGVSVGSRIMRLMNNQTKSQRKVQAKRERQGCILVSSGRMGTPGCVHKRAGGKRVCGRFRRYYAYGQQERPQLCWVGDHEESYDGDDGQRRGANKSRGHGICQRIGLIRLSYASWKYTGSSFTREALRGSWVYLPLDQRSKNTSHQKWQKDWLQYVKQCTICGSWFIDAFLYNALTYFIIIFITGFCFWHKQIHQKSSTRKKWKYEWWATGKTRCIKKQKPKTKIKMKDAKKYKEIYRMKCLIGYRNSARIWSMKVIL